MSEADTPGGSDEAALVPATGEIIAGRYRVLGTLGSGGFATVYRAQHLEIRTLEVALKLLHRPPGEVELARFRREAELAASLRHPNIVPVIDFGVLEGGQPFLVMELAEGRSLEEVIRERGGLSEPEAVTLLEGQLDALTLAHDRGIVHRDIKPANIIVEESEGEQRFRLLDFGIAKPLHDDENPLTVGDKTFCTPSYAAPELLRGKPTLATDLYALALTVAEALEGETVVDGDGIFEMAKVHLSPEALTFGPRVRASVLADILQQAVAKSLQERYPTARAMRAAWRAQVAAGLPSRPVGGRVGSAAAGDGAASLPEPGGAPLRQRRPERPAPVVDPGQPTDSRPISLLLSGPVPRREALPDEAAAWSVDSPGPHGAEEGRTVEEPREDESVGVGVGVGVGVYDATREAAAGGRVSEGAGGETTTRTALPARWRKAVPLAALLAVALLVVAALRAGLAEREGLDEAGSERRSVDGWDSELGLPENALRGDVNRALNGNLHGNANGLVTGDGSGAARDPAARAEARARGVEEASDRLAAARGRAAGGELDLRCAEPRCGLRAYWVPLGEGQVQEVALGALPLRGAGLPALRPLTVQYVASDGSAFLRTYRQAGAIEDHRVAAPEGTRSPAATPRRAPRVQQAPDALGTVPRVQ